MNGLLRLSLALGALLLVLPSWQRAQAGGSPSAAMQPNASNAVLPTARQNLGTRPILNAKTDYGAKGNNSANDGPALANALKACDQNHPLYLPPGIYLTRQQLYQPANCHFAGDANATWLGSDTPNVQIIADGTNGAFTGAAFTAAISGTTLTVSAISAGSIGVGNAIAGTGVAGFTFVTALGTGSGGTGTYTVNNSQTVTSEAMTGVPAVLTVGEAATLDHIRVDGDSTAGHADAIDIAGTDATLHYVVANAGGTYSLNCEGQAQLDNLDHVIVTNSQGTGAILSCPDGRFVNGYLNGASGANNSVLYINASHLRITGNKIEGGSAQTQGVFICCGIQYLVFSGNDVNDNYRTGLHLSGYGGDESDLIITNNTFAANGAGGEAGYDCHLMLEYSVANLQMSGNTFNKAVYGANPSSPNNIWCDNSLSNPALTGGSVINDNYAAQQVGIWDDTTIQAAIQPWLGSKPNAVTTLCRANPNTSSGSDTTEDTLATCAIPANLIAPNGALRVMAHFTMSGTGGNRTPRVRFSGAGGAQYMSTAGIATSMDASATIINKNATNAQVGWGRYLANNGEQDTGKVTSSVDTTAATSLAITCQKASAGDTCTLDSYTVELETNGT